MRGLAYFRLRIFEQLCSLRTISHPPTETLSEFDFREELPDRGVLAPGEERYRAVLDSQLEFISRSLPDTTLTFVNDAYCRYFGVREEEVVGTSFLRFVAPEHLERARAHVRDLLDHPRTVEYTHKVIRTDGQVVWNEWVDIPILNESGQVVEFQSVGRDITRRKEVEEQLARSSDRLAALRAIDQAVLRAGSEEEVASEAVTRLAAILPKGRSAAYVLDPTGAVRMLAAAGGEDFTDGGLAILPADLIVELGIWEALRRGESQAISDMRLLAPKSPYIQSRVDVGILSAFVVPLRAEGAFFGILAFGFPEPEAFGNEEVEIAREVAASVSIAFRQTQLVAELRRVNRRLQSLTRGLVESQEAQRREVAHELHEEIGQMLAAAKLGLHRVESDVPSNTLSDQIKLVGETIEYVRSLSMLLRPTLLEKEGLTSAIRWLVSEQLNGFEADLSLDLDETIPRLPLAEEVTCYRMVQVSVRHALRQKGITSLAVKARYEDQVLRVRVEDDGGVREPSKTFLDLERRSAALGGSLTIEPLDGGQRVVVELPIAPRR